MRAEYLKGKIRHLTDLPFPLLSTILSASNPSVDGKKKLLEIISNTAINWESVSTEANKHTLGVLIYQRLKELDLTKPIDAQIKRAWQADIQHAKMQTDVQTRDAITISNTLSQHGIRHAFLKGFAYRHSFYTPPWTRLGADIDILIDRHNCEITRRLLQNLGFIQAACTDDYQHFRPATQDEIRQTEANHYELAQFVKGYNNINPPDWLFGPDFIRRIPFVFEKKDEKVLFYTIVDIHWALHFILARESPLDYLCILDVTEIPILKPEWNLFTSSFKLYFEAFDRLEYGLHHLVDINGILKEYKHKIDWLFFQNLVERYNFEAAAFYTLSAAERLAGESLVPPEILTKWNRIPARQKYNIPVEYKNQNRHALMDFGDFIPYMLGRRNPGEFPTKSPGI